MPFSARQIHCLSAMGIVPWVERAQSVSATASATVCATAAELPSAPVADPPPVELAIHPQDSGCPADAGDAANWLVEQTLHRFGGPAGERRQLGKQNAAIAIVCDRGAESGNGAVAQADDATLSESELRLLDEMLRSIGATRRDACLCALSRGEQTGVVDRVADLSDAGNQIVFFLVHDLPESPDVAAHRLPMPGFTSPVWRLPHPGLLLTQPQRKRQAWNVLKAARRILTPVTTSS